MTTLQKPIGVLGAGNWGTVIALLASHNVPRVLLYDRNAERVHEINEQHRNAKYLPGITLPSSIVATTSLAEVFQECTLVMPVVPARAFRDLAQASSPFVRGDHFLVHGTKGLDPVTHQRMSQILAEETCCLRTGVLSGPTLAPELAQGKPGAVVIASRFDEVIQLTQGALSSSQLRVYGNREPVAVEWAGALKNILAITAGLIHELGMGQNALAMVVARGLTEISRLMAAMGTRSSTLYGLAGIGDIFVTCTSPISRNFRAGQMLARGKSPVEIEKELVMVVEGLNTLRVVIQLANQKQVDLPITQALWRMAFERQEVREAIQSLMDRPATYEQFGE